VFALKEGEICGPVKTPADYVLFKVDEIRPAKTVVYDDVKKDLAQSILADKTSKAWPDYIQELRASAKIVPTASETANRPRPSS
jgi:parvulin-like peptidyl-prolyl isomerase